MSPVGRRGAVRGGVEIRPALTADASALTALTRRAIHTSAAALYDAEALEVWASSVTEDRVRRRIEEADTFVAVVEGALAGWACLAVDVVDMLYVDPDHGGSGIAGRLYRAVEQRARAAGVQRLTATASLRAAPVFARFGFTEVARRPRSLDGHDFSVVQVVKRLG